MKSDHVKQVLKCAGNKITNLVNQNEGVFCLHFFEALDDFPRHGSNVGSSVTRIFCSQSFNRIVLTLLVSVISKHHLTTYRSHFLNTRPFLNNMGNHDHNSELWTPQNRIVSQNLLSLKCSSSVTGLIQSVNLVNTYSSTYFPTQRHLL